MKTFCRFFLATFAIGVLALMPGQVFSQSAPKPAVVISIAKMQEQLDDAKYLVDAAGFGQMAFLINVQADQFLKGIDDSKATGMLLYFDEESSTPKTLGFIPIKNMDDVLNTISNNLGEVDEGDDYTTVRTDSEKEIHIKQVGDYAFLSDDVSMFENIPDDPESLLGELPETYNMSARIFGQRIPKNLRQQWVDMIRDGYEAQLEQMGGDDLATELQQGNFDIQMEQLESMFHETDEIVIGFSADKESKTMFMEVEMTGLEDSELAKRCAATADAKPSQFSGFVNEDCAFNMNSCVTILAADAESYKTMIAGFREQALEEIEADGDLADEDLERIESALDEIIEVIGQTLDEGVLDSGAIARVKKGDVNLAIGTRLADPQRIETLVKKNVNLLKDELGDKVQIKLNSGSHQGVSMHTIIFTIPEEEEEMIENLGDEVTLILGFGDKALYLAAGNDPLPLLKEAMDRSESGTYSSPLAMQWNVYLGPIFKFAAGIENNEMIEVMADKLAETGNDRLGMTSSMMKKGMKMRFEVQDGVLKLIGAATEAMGQGFAPGENDF